KAMRTPFLVLVMAAILLSPPRNAGAVGDVVLVHGIRQDGSAWHGSGIESMVNEFHLCKLIEPSLGWRDAVAVQAQQLATGLNNADLHEATAIGYSLGGFVSREYLRQT